MDIPYTYPKPAMWNPFRRKPDPSLFPAKLIFPAERAEKLAYNLRKAGCTVTLTPLALGLTMALVLGQVVEVSEVKR